MSTKIVWLADMHTGSRWALADPKETPRHCPGKEIQKCLYDHYGEAVTGPWAKPHVLVLPGDIVDGQGTKDSGTHQWTPDMDEQVLHAAELIRMWKPTLIYVCGGSKYHVMVGDSGLSAEEMLAQKLGAEPYPNQEHLPLERQRRSGPHWFLTFEGVTVHAAHHIGVSRVFHYMSTPIAREMMKARLNDPMRRKWAKMYREECTLAETQKRLPDLPAELNTRIVIRAHAHYFWACMTGGSMGMILPAWKVPDPYILSRDTLGFGHIGFVGLEIDGDRFRFEQCLTKIEDVAPPPHVYVSAALTRKREGAIADGKSQGKSARRKRGRRRA